MNHEIPECISEVSVAFCV